MTLQRLERIALLFVFTALVVFFESRALAIAPAAAKIVLTATQKKAVSYKCSVSRYPAIAPPAAWRSATTIRTVSRWAIETRTKNIAGPYSQRATGSRRYLSLLRRDLNATPCHRNFFRSGHRRIQFTDTHALIPLMTAAMNGFSYHFITHLWCRDPNPPRDLATGLVFPTCRPFAFTLCTDPNGDVIKGPELAGMPSQLCPDTQYEAKWYSIYDKNDPSMLPP